MRPNQILFLQIINMLLIFGLIHLKHKLLTTIREEKQDYECAKELLDCFDKAEDLRMIEYCCRKVLDLVINQSYIKIFLYLHLFADILI